MGLPSDRFRVQAVNAVGASQPSNVMGGGTETVTFGQPSYTVAESRTVDVAVTLSRGPGRTVVIPITATHRGRDGRRRLHRRSCQA